MDNFKQHYGFDEEEWNTCLRVLTTLKNSPFSNPENEQFGTLITKIYKQAKKLNRKESYKTKKRQDLSAVLNTQISENALENKTKFTESNYIDDHVFTKLAIPKNCYCCNQSFSYLHSFYNRLCPSCAELNYQYRNESIDLSGRKVILTGGRVKIGFAAALKFLRANAQVLVTTRFPALALAQFKEEEDYERWEHNLVVYGLDLRDLRAVEQFAEYYKYNFESLNILVNNAAQTIKYTDQYYRPLIEKEGVLLDLYLENKKLKANKTSISEGIHMLNNEKELPELALNRFGQPIDDREKNSWNSTLVEVDMLELLEVNLINQISPYFLIKELTPLLKASSFEKKFIVNVTSSEGQFSYENKSVFHPHTNMTKASLNMLTRTAAKDYERHAIFMNAVDVGWVSTGAREELRKKQFDVGYIPPLDPVDGAARILAPIIEGIKDVHNPVGKLLKNYEIVNW